MTYVQSPRLKVTGPCFVGFQLPDFGLRVACGGVPQALWPDQLDGASVSGPCTNETPDDLVRSLVAELVQALVSGEVIVTVVNSKDLSTLEVRASAASLSVLIGPKGQMARALRTIVAGVSAKMGRRYALDLVAS